MSKNSANCLLFVMGMHRSGTSALCAALNACGADFGPHLLDSMEGVNEEGFWEDSDVVAVNELLLAHVGAQWYSVAEKHLEVDWRYLEFDEARDLALKVLQRGFGSNPLQAVKDPRFCITLRFWLGLCEDIGLPTRVCAISRAPEEIALSLEKRDGFPMGYGLRLFQVYRRGISKSAPSDAIYVSYDTLVHDPGSVVHEFAPTIPLAENKEHLKAVVRKDLRHQSHSDKQGLLYRPDIGNIDFADLTQEINIAHPIDQTLIDFATKLVNCGKKLSHIGQQHSKALATNDERDAQITELSGKHMQALATIDERDAQITELSGKHMQALATIDERDAQITGLSGKHMQALATIDERDAQITELSGKHMQALATIDERDAQITELSGKHMQALATIDERDAQIAELSGKHMQALATIDERDAQITALGGKHTLALATIDERDEQIRIFDERLSEIGGMHTQALEAIKEQDARLARVFKKPGIGLLFKMIWNHETR